MINSETHARFWVTLQRPYFDFLSQEAKKRNLSVTAYAGQILSRHIEEMNPEIVKNEFTPEFLNKTITTALIKIDYGKPFTVKDLFLNNQWESMTRSEKAIAAKILAAIERDREDVIIVAKVNRTSIYEKERG